MLYLVIARLLRLVEGSLEVGGWLLFADLRRWVVELVIDACGLGIGIGREREDALLNCLVWKAFLEMLSLKIMRVRFGGLVCATWKHCVCVCGSSGMVNVPPPCPVKNLNTLVLLEISGASTL